MSDAQLQLVALAMFAEINARLDGGESRSSVLTEKGLTEGEFQQEQQRWLSLLAAQAQDRQWQLQQRYSALYTQWRLKDNTFPEPAVSLSPTGETSRYASPTPRVLAEPTGGIAAAPFHAPPSYDRVPATPQHAEFAAARSDGSQASQHQVPAFQAPAFIPDNQPSETPAFLAGPHSPLGPVFTSNSASLAAHEFRTAPSAPPPGGGSFASPPPQGPDTSQQRNQHGSPNPSPLAYNPPHVASAASPGSGGIVLSFEQLTCLTAELDVNPAKASPALAGYGIDQASYETQHRALRVRCEADPDLQQRYERLLTYYRAVVSQR